MLIHIKYLCMHIKYFIIKYIHKHRMGTHTGLRLLRRSDHKVRNMIINKEGKGINRKDSNWMEHRVARKQEKSRRR